MNLFSCTNINSIEANNISCLTASSQTLLSIRFRTAAPGRNLVKKKSKKIKIINVLLSQCLQSIQLVDGKTDFCLNNYYRTVLEHPSGLLQTYLLSRILPLTLFVIQKFSVYLLIILVSVDILFADILWSLWPLEKE